jgi:hypothetical protein
MESTDSRPWSTSSKVPATAAAKCLSDDLDALVMHLRYPTRHRRRWRSTNLRSRVALEMSTCPPCPAAQIRAARWTSKPT